MTYDPKSTLQRHFRSFPIAPGFAILLVLAGFVALRNRADRQHQARDRRVREVVAALPTLTMQIDALRKKNERDLQNAVTALSLKIDALGARPSARPAPKVEVIAPAVVERAPLGPLELPDLAPEDPEEAIDTLQPFHTAELKRQS